MFMTIYQQGSMVLPIILYLDGTQLARNNKHSAKPVKIAIGNHPLHVMNRPDARKHVMFMPKAPFTKDSAAKRSSLSRQLLHFVLAKLLLPLAEAQKNGGVVAMYKKRCGIL